MSRLSTYKKHIGISLAVVGAIGLLVVLWFIRTHQNEPVAVAPDTVVATTTVPVLIPAKEYQYIEVVEGCNPYYVGTCVNMRSGTSSTSPVVERLRTGVVLRVAGTVRVDGHDWYKILQDKNIRFPERVKSDWYVYADAVHLFTDEGDKNLTKNSASTTKNIYVNLTEEMLYAYDGDVLFMSVPISTGLEYTPTPPGKFRVFRKTPSRYMQGPLPGVSTQVYDLPGVPWNLYFTNEGAVIHGAYWHDKFGQPWSHGCVNLAPENAKKLYEWADIGTPVTVQH